MHILNIIAATITLLAALVAFIRMWHCMRRGTARPNLFTWFVWAILAFVLLKSEWEAVGITWTLSLLFNDLACILITAIALSVQTVRNLNKLLDSQKPTKKEWCKNNAVELACLVAIGVATLVWWKTSSALTALVCYLVIDCTAVVPTLYALWGDYGAEDFFEWILFQIANTAVIFTVSEFTFEQLVYPVTVCMIALMVNVVRAIAWWRQSRQGLKQKLPVARLII